MNTKIKASVLILAMLFSMVAVSAVSYTRVNTATQECQYFYDGGSCAVNTKYCNKDGSRRNIIIDTIFCKGASTPPSGPALTNLEKEAGETCEMTVTEGEMVKINTAAFDPDSDVGPSKELIWYFSPPLDGVGRWQTQGGDAGIYPVSVSVSDGQYKDTVNFCIEVLPRTVFQGNEIPSLEADDITVVEGDVAVIRATSRDPEGMPVTIMFGAPFDNSGRWQTGLGDAGVRNVEVRASDGVTSASKMVRVTVLKADRAPIMEQVSDMIIREGETIEIAPEVYDPNGDDVSVSCSGWLNRCLYTTNYEDSGFYRVTVSASDGVNTVSQEVRITVLNVNRPPRIISYERA